MLLLGLGGLGGLGGLSGCDVGIAPFLGAGALPDGGGVGIDSGGPPGTGLPCAVAEVVSRCQGCHGRIPSGGAVISLLSRDDLVAAAYADPRVDVAHRALLRMQQGTMPPGGGAAASDVQVLRDWIAAGEPAGVCAGPDAAVPPDQPVPGDAEAPGSGLPCELTQLIAARCASCHGHPAAGGAPMSLVTRDELLAPSTTDPRSSFAQRAVLRMLNNTMPPGGGNTVADVALLQNWIAAGSPSGSCGPPDAGPPPPDLPPPPRDAGPPLDGLPCEVAALYQQRCARCHGNPPSQGAPMSLTSLADLLARSIVNPQQDYAQRSVARIEANTMPPGGGVSAQELAVLKAWVAAGKPAGACQPPDAGVVDAGPAQDLALPPLPDGGLLAGLPCDVATVYQTRCLRCHGRPPTQNAPMSLVSRADLLTPSLFNPQQDYATRSVIRMQAGTMPPGGGATAAEIATVQAWVNGGEIAGACLPPDGGVVVDAGPAPDLARPPVDGGPPGSGLPCDVAQMIENHCASCHGNPPAHGATVSLMTYADLTATSYADPKVDFAHRMLVRMQANTMPPGGGAAQADITTLSNWIAGGEKQGNCPPPGADGGVVQDPLNAAAICTKGVDAPMKEGPTMDSGQACIACHAKHKDAPVFLVAGTVYSTGHEPDQCSGGPVMGVASVVITDSKAKTYTLTVNSTGNFYLDSQNGAITLPYTAKVTYNGKERVMNASQMSGDCNGCHTQNGANGAPGRITLPAP